MGIILFWVERLRGKKWVPGNLRDALTNDEFWPFDFVLLSWLRQKAALGNIGQAHIHQSH